MWDANATFWDGHIGPDGNEFHRALVAPAQMRLLALQAGERVLELACGNGQFSRQMTRAGASVVACDFSEVFVELARAHAADAGLAIDHRVADATDVAQMLALGAESSFDAAVCTMAVHNIADLAPMAHAVHQLLKPNGRFVLSVQHPAFNSTNPVFVSETADEDGVITTRYALKIFGYAGHAPELGTGIRGQPEPHWYFPRTFAELLAPFFDAAWTLNGLEEPAFPPAMAQPEKPYVWANLAGIPPVLVVRLVPWSRR